MSYKRILIVDDEPDMLSLLELELSGQGYEIEKAYNGSEAIKKAKVFMPHLILIDVMMPELDGPQAVQLLQKDVSTKMIPIIFLTAIMTKEEEKNRHLKLEIGGRFYPAIAKPFDPEKLVSQIHETVSPEDVTET